MSELKKGMSTPGSSRPNSGHIISRPSSSKFGSRSSSALLSSRPNSGIIVSRPSSSIVSSRPSSGIIGSRPNSSQLSSRPNSSKFSGSPGTSLAGSRPGSSVRSGSVRGSRKTISRPTSSNVSSRLGSVRSGIRPVSTKSVRLLVSSQGSYAGDSKQNCDDWGSDCDLNASGSSFGEYETEEGRLSRALQNWMPEYVVHEIEPRERVRREPVFSARLGRQPRIPRIPSEESIATQLSLLSCSSNGKRKQKIRKRRRKKKPDNAVQKDQTVSKWVALANIRVGALDRMMKLQAAQTIGIPDTGPRIFDMLEKDEQKMVFNCGMSKGLHLCEGLKKSGSETDVRREVKKTRRRRASEGETEIKGPAIDFQELCQQIVKQRQAQLAKKQMLLARQSTRLSLKKKSRGSRRGMVKSQSSSSLLSSNRSVSGVSEATIPMTVTTTEDKPEVKTTMWAGDHKILEIDLNRELTNNAKKKITTTTRALNRVTGYGDDNGLRTTVGTLAEYPFLVDEDYGFIPKIVQNVRISPHLSRVIQQDIKVRMGRPRYHEISERDLVMWNRGQELDRTHRNLKVFNWLHSLREDEFESVLDPDVVDRPPGVNADIGDMIHIGSVDEPKVKPLLERLKTEYVV